uniref:Odorant receptor 41 n=1 Tax=Eucryptorrhynchus brandti TaxID=436910 RepID=A0A8F4MYX7_EUCBR|nr:odorant receptor 41 [Eucryptorrhynchus brandti]
MRVECKKHCVKKFYHAFDDFQENCAKFSNRRIKNTLKLLIQRHQAIMELFLEAKHGFLVPVTILTISVLFFGMFCVLMLYSPYYDNKRSIASIVAWGFTTFYFSYQGQSFEDLDEYLRKSLYNLNWYEWDVSNRKMLHIFFLTNTGGVQQRTTFAKVNHEYFKQNVRFLFAIANLARQLASR